MILISPLFVNNLTANNFRLDESHPPPFYLENLNIAWSAENFSTSFRLL